MSSRTSERQRVRRGLIDKAIADDVQPELVEWCTSLDAEILKMCRQQARKLFGKEVYLESDLKPNYYSPRMKSTENTSSR